MHVCGVFVLICVHICTCMCVYVCSPSWELIPTPQLYASSYIVTLHYRKKKEKKNMGVNIMNCRCDRPRPGGVIRRIHILLCGLCMGRS